MLFQFFTDRSKTETATGFRILINDLHIIEPMRLPNMCTVLQAEIYTISVAVKKNSQILFVPRLLIYIDSLPIIKAFNLMYLNQNVN